MNTSGDMENLLRRFFRQKKSAIRTSDEMDREIVDYSFEAYVEARKKSFAARVPKQRKKILTSPAIRVAASALIVLVVVFIIIFSGPDELPKQVPGDATVAKTVQEDKPVPSGSSTKSPDVLTDGITSDRTYPEVELELAKLQTMFGNGDIDGLISMLDSPLTQIGLAAAGYLARFEDVRAIDAHTKWRSKNNANQEIAKSSAEVKDVADNRILFDRPSIFESGLKDASRFEFDGREVVVRVYTDYLYDPSFFEKIPLKLSRHTVKFDSIGIETTKALEPLVLAVLGQDQNDPNIRQLLSESIHIWVFEKGLSFTLPFTAVSEQPTSLVFMDALGNPIPGAIVEIFLRTGHSKDSPRIRLKETLLDESGTTELLFTKQQAYMLDFTLAHPDYGIAFAGYSHFPSPGTIYVPLVKRNTEGEQRSIWGVVLEPNGVPIADAVLECSNIQAIGGTRFSAHGADIYKTITDDQGRFFFYLPNTQGGKLIPRKSVYFVRIKAPEELNLLGFQDNIENGKPATIVMERGDHFHTFAFEGSRGPIIELEQQKKIHIRITRPDQPWITLGYDKWKDGGSFPLGTYHAMMGIDSGKVEFQPIEVTEQSPEELVFGFAPARTYYGQVIHGLTSEPMPGAFVIGMWSSSTGNNLSHITQEQWELLHELPPDPCVDDESLKPVRAIYGFDKVTRTDENGRFEMTFSGDENLYGLIAFEEYFLGIKHRKDYLEADENETVQVPAFKLYPAAKIVFEAHVNEKHVSLMPEWIIETTNNPVWVKDFLKIDDDRMTDFTYARWLEQNQTESFHVPAGINLKVRLEAPYDPQWCPITIDEVLNLQHGQVYDIGVHEFGPALDITVKILNSSNQPVEGVPVRKERGTNHWGSAHISDVNGITEFHIRPHSSVVFGVHYHSKDEGIDLKESVSYDIGGEEDMNRQFIFTLSDEILQHLFKR